MIPSVTSAEGEAHSTFDALAELGQRVKHKVTPEPMGVYRRAAGKGPFPCIASGRWSGPPRG